MLESAILRYADDHSEGEDPVLKEVERATHLQTLYPQMLSGKVQGTFLTMLASLIQASHILEIGTFTGYGTICLARGLNAHPPSKVVTLESNREFEHLIRRHLVLAEVTNRVELVLGDALQIIPGRRETWDLVYIDGNKQEYPDYYRLVFDQVRPGGLIITDNVLWGGKVVNDPEDVDAKTIRAYNDMLVRDPRVQVVLLTVRDGISIARKR